MKFLVATSQAFVLYDTDRGTAIIHEGSGVYSGITWSADHTYVSALQNAGEWNAQTKKNDPTREQILVFDAALNLIDTRTPGTFDMHAIHWCSVRNRLLACDTGNDRILSLGPSQGRPEVFWQLPPIDAVPAKGAAGHHHLNSVWTNHRGGVLVLARHAYPAKGLLWCLRPNLELRRCIAVPEEAHTAYETAEGFTLCASYAAALWAKSGLRIVPLRVGYPRGIAEVDGTVYIGGSARGARDVRHGGLAQFARIDADDTVFRTRLGPLGQVYAVRATGGIDLAHHGGWGPRCPVTPDTLDALGRQSSAL